MAETTSHQRDTYPLPAYNFRVTIGGEAMSFSEVSGVSIEFETVTYKHGLSFSEGEVLKKYRYDRFVPIRLKKGTVRGNYLYEWLKSMDTRRLDISLCDEQGNAVVNWIVGKAVPVKLEAPTFDANTNDVSIDTLEVMASHISVEHVS